MLDAKLVQKHNIVVVGMAKLGVDFDASCIITHTYQPCPATIVTGNGNGDIDCK